MNKFIFFLLLFLVTSSLVFAEYQVDLSEHGKDLMRAPFPVRYNFSKAYHKDWTNSTYSEREIFLNNWHRQLIIEEKKAQIKKKEEDRLELEKQKAKAAEIKRERDKIKEEERKIKNEDRVLNQRNKSFNIKTKTQSRMLERLQAQSSSLK